MALNTLAFLATAWMVFTLAHRRSGDPATGWLAAAVFVVGGYSIEYAQGLWPHSLTAALCTAAVLAAAGTWEDGREGPAVRVVLAGLAAGGLPGSPPASATRTC